MHLEPLDGENVFVIHDLLSARECEELIARSEALGYEAAAVGGELLPQLRNNGRAFLEDPALAAERPRSCPGGLTGQRPAGCTSDSGSTGTSRPSSSGYTWTARCGAARRRRAG